MPTRPNIIYLHGFASSPKSHKAQIFKRELEAYEITLQIPDLNRPSFERLTLTDMLDYLAQVIRNCPPGPVYLIGSSMGGLLAVQFVHHFKEAEARRVELLFLLAPALDFIANRHAALSVAELKRWHDEGWIEVHNYALDAPARVHYGLYQDIEKYDSFNAHVEVPVIIYHGDADESVPLEQSVRFAQSRANVRLRVVPSDHSLTDQVEAIWKDMVSFFAL